MKHYTVVCRLAFDEEDSIYTYEANGEDVAVRMAEQEIREAADEPYDEEGGGRDFFVNFVISTVEKPTVTSWR